MWYSESSYKDVISLAWTLVSLSDVVENFLTRLYNCSNELIKWNLNTFEHVGDEIYKLES